jgi:hypothetical protein
VTAALALAVNRPTLLFLDELTLEAALTDGVVLLERGPLSVVLFSSPLPPWGPMEKIYHTDFEYVPPQLVHVRFRGVLDMEELRVVFDRVSESIAGQSFLLVQVEWGEVEKVTPEARRLAAERLSELPNHAIAIVGGNFGQRVIARLVLTAAQMLTPGRTKSGFFKDNDSAREWLLQAGKDSQESKAPG